MKLLNDYLAVMMVIGFNTYKYPQCLAINVYAYIYTMTMKTFANALNVIHANSRDLKSRLDSKDIRNLYALIVSMILDMAMFVTNV